MFPSGSLFMGIMLIKLGWLQWWSWLRNWKGSELNCMMSWLRLGRGHVIRRVVCRVDCDWGFVLADKLYLTVNWQRVLSCCTELIVERILVISCWPFHLTSALYDMSSLTRDGLRKIELPRESMIWYLWLIIGRGVEESGFSWKNS